MTTLWKAVGWLLQVCCPHVDTVWKVTERRPHVECLRCGWKSPGWRLER